MKNKLANLTFSYNLVIIITGINKPPTSQNKILLRIILFTQRDNHNKQHYATLAATHRLLS